MANTYRVRTRLENTLLLPFGTNHIVTFTTSDSDCLPLPDPRYLMLHATVCRIAPLSGLSGYLASGCCGQAICTSFYENEAGYWMGPSNGGWG